MKLLHRFCSPEVRLILTRLEEHPEEYLTSERWDQHICDYGEYFRQFTRVERFCISRKREQMVREEKKKAAYASVYATMMGNGVDQTHKPKYSIFNQSQAGMLQPGQMYNLGAASQAELDRLARQLEIQQMQLRSQAILTKTP